MIKPTTIKQALTLSTKLVEIVRISNEPQEVSVSEVIPFCLRPLRDTHPLLLSSSKPICLLVCGFLENHHAGISPKGGNHSRI